MSLHLDIGNFEQAWIDGKKVNELWFRGEKIYDSTKFYAFGNKWTGSSITTAYGGSSKYVWPYNYSTSLVIRSCIGYTNVLNSKHRAIFLTNSDLKQFTEVKEGSINDLKTIIGVDSLTQCKAVYYVTQFKNNTYSGDIFVKPFIRTAYTKNNTDITLGSSSYGIGTEYTDSTPNDFCWTYKAENKGTYIKKKFKLTDEQITKIESNNSTNIFLCTAYKTNSETTSTQATLYYGGYLLIEVV